MIWLTKKNHPIPYLTVPQAADIDRSLQVLTSTKNLLSSGWIDQDLWNFRRIHISIPQDIILGKIARKKIIRSIPQRNPSFKVVSKLPNSTPLIFQPKCIATPPCGFLMVSNWGVCRNRIPPIFCWQAPKSSELRPWFWVGSWTRSILGGCRVEFTHPLGRQSPAMSPTSSVRRASRRPRQCPGLCGRSGLREEVFFWSATSGTVYPFGGLCACSSTSWSWDQGSI